MRRGLGAPVEPEVQQGSEPTVVTGQQGEAGQAGQGGGLASLGQPGPVSMGLSPSGLIVKPGSVYYIRVPVRPLNAEVDQDHLRRLAKSSNALGTMLLVAGLVILLLSAAFKFPWTTQILAGIAIGVGVLTGLHGLVICGAPGTLASLLLGSISAGFGVFLVFGRFPLDSLPLVFSIWLFTKGLATAMLGLTTAAITTWPALLVSGVASWGIAGWLMAFDSSASLARILLLTGLDLGISGLAFLLLSWMAMAGYRMTEGSAEAPPAQTLSSSEYQPLSSA